MGKRVAKGTSAVLISYVPPTAKTLHLKYLKLLFLSLNGALWYSRPLRFWSGGLIRAGWAQGPRGVLQDQPRAFLASQRIEVKFKWQGSESRVCWRPGGSADTARIFGRFGKERRVILPFLEVWDFYWGLWSGVYVFSRHSGTCQYQDKCWDVLYKLNMPWNQEVLVSVVWKTCMITLPGCSLEGIYWIGRLHKEIINFSTFTWRAYIIWNTRRVEGEGVGPSQNWGSKKSSLSWSPFSFP